MDDPHDLVYQKSRYPENVDDPGWIGWHAATTVILDLSVQTDYPIICMNLSRRQVERKPKWRSGPELPPFGRSDVIVVFLFLFLSFFVSCLSVTL